LAFHLKNPGLAPDFFMPVTWAAFPANEQPCWPLFNYVGFSNPHLPPARLPQDAWADKVDGFRIGMKDRAFPGRV